MQKVQYHLFRLYLLIWSQLVIFHSRYSTLSLDCTLWPWRRISMSYEVCLTFTDFNRLYSQSFLWFFFNSYLDVSVHCISYLGFHLSIYPSYRTLTTIHIPAHTLARALRFSMFTYLAVLTNLYASIHLFLQPAEILIKITLSFIMFSYTLTILLNRIHPPPYPSYITSLTYPPYTPSVTSCLVSFNYLSTLLCLNISLLHLP